MFALVELEKNPKSLQNWSIEMPTWEKSAVSNKVHARD